MRKLTVGGDRPVRLVRWFKTEYPALPGAVILSALRRKDVRVNGRRCGEDAVLQPGDEVALFIDDAVLNGTDIGVVWYSDRMIAAVKPAGVVSKDGSGGDMEARAARWLEAKGEPPFVLACHRLDAQTGGLMLLARSEEAAAAVRAMMEAGKIRKTYACVVRGRPEPPRATLTAYLLKDAARSVVTMLDRPAPGAKTAVTEYAVVKTDGARSLLEVTLHTGRTHQIRAHLAHIGHPLLGDDKYGDRAFNRQFGARRQMLWAQRLDFLFSAQECPLFGELAHSSLSSPAPFLHVLD